MSGYVCQILWFFFKSLKIKEFFLKKNFSDNYYSIDVNRKDVLSTHAFF